MTQTLQEAIKNTEKALESIKVGINIDKEFVESVIGFAQENNGVGSKYSNSTYSSEDYKLAAQQLSYQYQQIASQSQLLTGKKNPKEFVGARLKRIPTRYTEYIVGGVFIH